MAKSKATDPVILEMGPRTMAVVTTKGDPNVEMPRIMPALFGAVYALKFKVLKPAGVEFKVGALVGRWPDAHLVPKDQWTALWGLEVPGGVTSVPQKVAETPVALQTWEYGTVAQVLHLGPYTAEGPAIQRLHQFIEESGYEIAGVHEEEYLTKPDAKVQKTLIRYPVRKK